MKVQYLQGAIMMRKMDRHSSMCHTVYSRMRLVMAGRIIQRTCIKVTRDGVLSGREPVVIVLWK